MKKILSILMALLILAGCSKAAGGYDAELYFLNADSSKMVVETRNFKKSEKLTLLEEITKALIMGPTSAELKAAIPKETKLLGITLDAKTAVVNLSRDFESGSDIEKLWSRYTLISTLCSVEGVQKTKILVEGDEIVSISTGEALGALGKNDIIIDAPPTENKKRIVTLYFANSDATHLIPEKRIVAIKDNETSEFIVVSEIIRGPKTDGFYATVSPDVLVRSVETKEGVCFVNLSKEFVTKNVGGSTKEGFAIFSIVNSLCKLDGVDKVQFLIDGQKIETFGHWVFNEPFTEDANYFKQ